MERLYMYSQEDWLGSMFCMEKDWNKVKHQLHGKVNYMYFNVKSDSKAALSERIYQCMYGSATPAGGGHLCLK